MVSVMGQSALPITGPSNVSSGEPGAASIALNDGVGEDALEVVVVMELQLLFNAATAAVFWNVIGLADAATICKLSNIIGASGRTRYCLTPTICKWRNGTSGYVCLEL